MNRNPLFFAVLALLSVLAIAFIVHFIKKDISQHNQNKTPAIESSVTQ